VDYKDLNTGSLQFGRAEIRKKMFQGRSLSEKIRGKSQKNVLSRTFPTNIQKLLVIFYGLLKMTTECCALDSEPEPTNRTIKTIFTEKSNYKKCFNIPSGHRFAFKIHQPLPHLNLMNTNKPMASILEEHFHYMDLYADFLNQKIERMEFANTKRIQMYLAKSLKENCGRILTALALLAVIGKVIGYKTLILILFAINLIQPTHAKKPTTLQGLHNTLLYIRFRINYNWLSSGFGEQQYREMEAALVDAIIQLQQIVTPPPTKPTSATKIPMFQTNNKRIHSILHSFVNKTLNKQVEEKEETPTVSGLTIQQEQMYATE
jgi:hypothetical protein